LFSANKYDVSARQGMLEDGCVEAVIALPPSLFHATRIPVCVWLLAPPGAVQDEILLVDAARAGYMATRTRRVIEESEIHRIADAIDAWRANREVDAGPTFGVVTLSELRDKNYNLTPSVYLARGPVSPAASNAQTLARDLTNRLAVLQEQAAEKDAAADRMLKGLKWRAH
jgi:type I restriction enzyme M protein